MVGAFATFQRHGSLQQHLGCILPSQFASRLKSTKESDDVAVNDDSDATPVMSKAKWKKKRYLMMQDVIGLIEKRDGRASRKAQEVVTRMLKLSKVHRDDSMKPDAQVYNVRYSREWHLLWIVSENSSLTDKSTPISIFHS